MEKEPDGVTHTCQFSRAESQREKGGLRRSRGLGRCVWGGEGWGYPEGNGAYYVGYTMGDGLNCHIASATSVPMVYSRCSKISL